MISRADILLLLADLKDQGINVEEDINKLYSSQTIPIETLKKINDNRPLDLLKFYEKLRESYNKKRSKLYINIMRSDENTIENAKTILTTLSALLNQILLFNCDDVSMFYTHARAEEIIKVLEIYFNTKNITPAYKLLTLFKADIKALDMIK